MQNIQDEVKAGIEKLGLCDFILQIVIFFKKNKILCYCF